MIRRQIEPLLRDRLGQYPAVALVGPRQCGKTTLARALGGLYFDLEQEQERLRVDLEWGGLEASRALVILDEAQSQPAIFPRLRGAIDRDRKRRGRFLLLGSVSPSLMTRVSESLAGRLSLVELTPFLTSELETRAARESLWLCGGYPDGGVLERQRYPRWQRDYLALLTQRDLPNWGLTAGPQVTERFLRMLAAVHGQAWNASQIGQSLGLSYHTVNGYLDYLVGAFLIRRLPPYRASIRKRLVKSPKVYWRDTGLLHAQMNVPDQQALLAQPWVGASWEGLVIEQVIGVLNSAGRQFEAFFFRTSDQHELDLVLDLGNDTLPGPADMDRLDKTAEMIGASRRYLVSQTGRTAGDALRASCNLQALVARLLN
jgi:predicted AAA+ superfamily ATPase